MPAPTADTTVLTAAAQRLFERIYRAGYRYAKTGITLSEIAPAVAEQADLFAEPAQGNDGPNLMDVVDAINRRFGKNLVATGSIAQGHHWQPKAERLSPHYLSLWSDLPSAMARAPTPF